MAQVLYAAIAGPTTTSDLYTVDQATGTMTSVGPSGYALTGLAFDPTTGTLYGATSQFSASHPRALVTVDPATGAGTLVADFTGLSGNAVSDIAFDASGQLWGWYSVEGRLVSINKATGVCVLIGGALFSDFAGGLDFSSGGTLYHVRGAQITVETVNTSTGAVTTVVHCSDSHHDTAGKFDEHGVWWAAAQQSSTNVDLVTIDLVTGTVTKVADFSIALNIDALAFGPAAVSANFSLALSSSTLTIPDGSSDTTTVTATLLSGPSDTAALTTGALPSGVTVGFSPTSISESGGSSTITVSVAADALPGIYTISIEGTDSDETVSTTLTLTIPAPNGSCADASVLVGCSGTALGNNTAWAGSWPTGADPLFNAEGVGGGAPLWWKWTNTRSRPMLFRFGVTAAPLDTYNAGIAVGVCGALDMSESPGGLNGINVEGGNLSFRYSGSNFGTGGAPTYFDIVVDPGHSAYVELDSYDGTASEPPVPSLAQKGTFSFAWWASETPTSDDIEGEVLPDFPSELLIDPVSPIDDPAVDPFGQINPYGTLRLGDLLYLLWGETDTHGQSIFAGVCNLDGAGLATTLIWNQHASSLPNVLVDVDQPRLMSDGNGVYVGFPWFQDGGVANPNYSDSCASHPPVFFCAECANTAGSILHYDIYSYDGAGWPLLVSIGDVANGQPYTQVDMSDPLDSFMLRSYLLRACASPSQPGTLWVHAEYVVGERNQSLHFNPFPLVGPPPGARYCTDDLHYETEYVDTFSVDTGTGAVTLVNRSSHEIGDTQRWDHDDLTVDPAFGTWQFFDSGDLVTDPTLQRTAITCVSMDLRNDDGFPLLARCGIRYWTWGASPASPGAHTVELSRPDTGAALGSYSYNDFAAGYDTRTNVWCQYIALSERWPSFGGHQRGIGTYWSLDGFQDGNITWLDRIASDGSAAPAWLVDGQSQSSHQVALAMTLVNDPASSAPQFWKVNWTPRGLDASSLDCYDTCSRSWSRVNYTSFGELGATYLLSEQTYYDPASDYFYILNEKNQLRRNKILRNYGICALGSPCQNGLFAWQRFS